MALMEPRSSISTVIVAASSIQRMVTSNVVGSESKLMITSTFNCRESCCFYFLESSPSLPDPNRGEEIIRPPLPK
ncbi:hypothetical protein V6N11_022079 [Hibiscus sabdariffa]|uniref:Uncharacterized protein n=1 Tax=Hibiscus sabdariffa TaxID=183260 RepID=A0ABR2TI44_9ROSI